MYQRERDRQPDRDIGTDRLRARERVSNTSTSNYNNLVYNIGLEAHFHGNRVNLFILHVMSSSSSG